MTENDLEQLRQYGATFAGDDGDALTDERVNYSIVFDGDIDLIPVESDELAAAAARIAELEAERAALIEALTPFAEAAEDDDVNLTNSKTCLLLEDGVFGSHKPIYSTKGMGAFLTVYHLRKAAETIKAVRHE